MSPLKCVCIHTDITPSGEKVKTPDGSGMRWSDMPGIKELNLRLGLLIPLLKQCASGLEGGSPVLFGAWSAKKPSAFTKTVESVKGLVHDTIPPGAHTYQAEVETAHGIIEDEFYEIETFTSLPILLAKATQYVIWFNIARRNSYKNNKTPGEIIHERDPTILLK